MIISPGFAFRPHFGYLISSHCVVLLTLLLTEYSETMDTTQSFPQVNCEESSNANHDLTLKSIRYTLLYGWALPWAAQLILKLLY